MPTLLACCLTRLLLRAKSEARGLKYALLVVPCWLVFTLLFPFWLLQAVLLSWLACFLEGGCSGGGTVLIAPIMTALGFVVATGIGFVFLRRDRFASRKLQCLSFQITGDHSFLPELLQSQADIVSCLCTVFIFCTIIRVPWLVLSIKSKLKDESSTVNLRLYCLLHALLVFLDLAVLPFILVLIICPWRWYFLYRGGVQLSKDVKDLSVKAHIHLLIIEHALLAFFDLLLIPLLLFFILCPWRWGIIAKDLHQIGKQELSEHKSPTFPMMLALLKQLGFFTCDFLIIPFAVILLIAFWRWRSVVRKGFAKVKDKDLGHTLELHRVIVKYACLAIFPDIPLYLCGLIFLILAPWRFAMALMQLVSLRKERKVTKKERRSIWLKQAGNAVLDYLLLLPADENPAAPGRKRSVPHVIIWRHFALLLLDAPWPIFGISEMKHLTPLRNIFHYTVLLTLWRSPLFIYRSINECESPAERNMLGLRVFLSVLLDIPTALLLLFIICTIWRVPTLYKIIKSHQRGDNEHKEIFFLFLQWLVDIPCALMVSLIFLTLWRIPSFKKRLSAKKEDTKIHKIIAAVFCLWLIDILLFPLLLVIAITLWRLPYYVCRMRARKPGSSEHWVLLEAFLQWLIDIPVMGMILLITLTLWRIPTLIKRLWRYFSYGNMTFRSQVLTVFWHWILDILVSPFLFFIVITVWRIPTLIHKLRKTKKEHKVIMLTFVVLMLDWPCILFLLTVVLTLWRVPTLIKEARHARSFHKLTITMLKLWVYDLPVVPFGIFVGFFPYRSIPMVHNLFTNDWNERECRTKVLQYFAFTLSDILLVVTLPIVLILAPWRIVTFVQYVKHTVPLLTGYWKHSRAIVFAYTLVCYLAFCDFISLFLVCVTLLSIFHVWHLVRRFLRLCFPPSEEKTWDERYAVARALQEHQPVKHFSPMLSYFRSVIINEALMSLRDLPHLILLPFKLVGAMCICILYYLCFRTRTHIDCTWRESPFTHGKHQLIDVESAGKPSSTEGKLDSTDGKLDSTDGKPDSTDNTDITVNGASSVDGVAVPPDSWDGEPWMEYDRKPREGEEEVTEIKRTKPRSIFLSFLAEIPLQHSVSFGNKCMNFHNIQNLFILTLFALIPLVLNDIALLFLPVNLLLIYMLTLGSPFWITRISTACNWHSLGHAHGPASILELLILVSQTLLFPVFVAIQICFCFLPLLTGLYCFYGVVSALDFWLELADPVFWTNLAHLDWWWWFTQGVWFPVYAASLHFTARHILTRPEQFMLFRPLRAYLWVVRRLLYEVIWLTYEDRILGGLVKFCFKTRRSCCRFGELLLIVVFLIWCGWPLAIPPAVGVYWVYAIVGPVSLIFIWRAYVTIKKNWRNPAARPAAALRDVKFQFQKSTTATATATTTTTSPTSTTSEEDSNSTSSGDNNGRAYDVLECVISGNKDEDLAFGDARVYVTGDAFWAALKKIIGQSAPPRTGALCPRCTCAPTSWTPRASRPAPRLHQHWFACGCGPGPTTGPRGAAATWRGY
ncbi:hypothetical protein Pelo_10762 [Pelomyxa schiedti]|nr:hypothetical protein Pelo_10762 [Pelomyxa schiedti]